MHLIKEFFPYLTKNQIEKFSLMKEIYNFWNNKINIISKKSLNNFYIIHVLHSLSIAKIITFVPKTIIMDLGTGGGFPGIPLSIFFEKSYFFLIDSIKKKISIVKEIINELNLKNVYAYSIRAENIEYKFDFIINRFVMKMPLLVKLVKNKFILKSKNVFKNGIFSFKGGNLKNELKNFNKKNIKVFYIYDLFPINFFLKKK
ncbi:16S rRNA (guanine(527)-N(7))-methyltransferase RsmG [Candidatus Shikimatogenerans silvanidophilus]|uniref:16S rRNA (guanine(527)-N(7))-methyltransferase RsmG n=1 Tax=Candidatus Shikimatogenerans silvanidophilus TaxID=2782547 RepID=UPI001BA78811|nr:16S rRNA (guanine(527)-N(7))-methyltransferase RsmG [Candidatus Shikimatogenerans silvanidophilus]